MTSLQHWQRPGSTNLMLIVTTNTCTCVWLVLEISAFLMQQRRSHSRASSPSCCRVSKLHGTDHIDHVVAASKQLEKVLRILESFAGSLDKRNCSGTWALSRKKACCVLNVIRQPHRNRTLLPPFTRLEEGLDLSCGDKIHRSKWQRTKSASGCRKHQSDSHARIGLMPGRDQKVRSRRSRRFQMQPTGARAA